VGVDVSLSELRPDDETLAGETVIPPHKQKGWVLELKATMKAGEALGFEYEADGPLAFNIHSHHGKEITHHVHVDDRQAAGEFISPQAYDYYPMWENSQDRPVKLKYRIWRK